MATVRLTTPLTEEAVRELKAGDDVLISGTMYTGRDAVHKYLAGGGAVPAGVDLNGAVIYHCGPVVIERGEGDDRKFTVKAAGPTTSIREEPYQAGLIGQYGLRGVIGKGGMGAKTLEACREHGAVYLHAIGGAAQVYAECIERVDDVYLEEFGSPEAIWVLHVRDFPAIVTMDSHGSSLHADVSAASLSALKGAF
jgi:fumarate hydratase class I